MIPEPGSKKYEDMVDFMRKDQDSGMKISKMIQSVKNKFKEEGRDFNQEFNNWKKENNLC